MTLANNTHSPRLDAPGAGLPLLEKWIAKYILLPRFWKRTSWEKAQELFNREGEKILAYASSLTSDKVETRVLIPRIQGIEDSSRYWSVELTMEHLIIVGTQMSNVIISLSQGQVPQYQADIAAMKPKGSSRSTIQKDFQNFIFEFQKKMSTNIGNRNSNARFRHPWFGELTASQWHGLCAIHQNIHKNQIKSIIAGLNH